MGLSFSMNAVSQVYLQIKNMQLWRGSTGSMALYHKVFKSTLPNSLYRVHQAGFIEEGKEFIEEIASGVAISENLLSGKLT